MDEGRGAESSEDREIRLAAMFHGHSQFETC